MAVPRTHLLDTEPCMSYHNERNIVPTVRLWPLSLCIGTFIYIAGAAFFSGLSGCGSSYFVTQFLGISVAICIGVGLFSYTRIYRNTSGKKKWLGAIALAISYFLVSTLFSAGGWTYYMNPASVSTAIPEFWQALQGNRCA